MGAPAATIGNTLSAQSIIQSMTTGRPSDIAFSMETGSLRNVEADKVVGVGPVCGSGDIYGNFRVFYVNHTVNDYRPSK